MGLLQSHWICEEKADKRWAARSHTMPPSSVEEAIVLIDAGALAKTIQVSIRPDGKFEKITNYVIGDKPQSEEIEELPF